MWTYDLKKALSDKHKISNGIRIVEYSTPQFNLSIALQRVIANKYLIDESIPLSAMHKYISPELLVRHKQDSGHWSDHISTLGEELIGCFHDFIIWLSDNIGHDFVFEKDPLVRYHIPGKLDNRYRLDNGELFTLHSDTLLCDYFQQINVWLPLCDVKNSATLNMVNFNESVEALNEFSASLAFCSKTYRSARMDFFNFMKEKPDLMNKLKIASSPINMKYGQCLLFDPRVLHGTAENISNETRVSIDFRVVPVDDYNKIMTEINRQQGSVDQYEGDRLLKGEFYNQYSAHELKIAKLNK